ncbi:alpha/beta hydrolase [Streptomyces sp. HC44]|uniref:Alpha/beta hydrolase n=1 Tax=Streptomyces scabichelini TaxID=2711217 RepID=A0A6G4V8J3_9ACTN|nr:alpha/beta hydrolase [Streptomyces scabichelini]
MTRAIPLFTLKGVPDAGITTHPFITDDGIGLSMLRFERGASDDVVLIIHGLTTSSDMFIMPEHRNLVTCLLDNGYSDVWTLDYRMSNRHPYNRARHRYTMDDIALFDYPAALREMRAEIGPDRRIHVIAHCLGSVSFTMSLFGGAVDNIASVIANSAALTPRVPNWSRFKLAVAPNLTEYVLGFPYLDPRWADEPRFTPAWAFSQLVDLFHQECDESSCHMLSMMWGTGWPALYSHNKLHEITHRRSGDLYGATGVHYYRHVAAMVRAGRAVKYEKDDPVYDRLPDDYLAGAAEIDTPMLLTTGDRNRVFTDSNVVCHQRLEAVAPGRHELAVFPGYGHQDVFMGERVDRDIFPRMLDFLKQHGA